MSHLGNGSPASQETPVAEASVITKTMEDVKIQPGDFVIRNLDGKEYKVEEVRSNGVLIYTGIMGGYRTLKPDEFSLKK